MAWYLVKHREDFTLQYHTSYLRSFTFTGILTNWSLFCANAAQQWREVLWIRRVAANILNEQSRTTDKG